MTNQEINSVIDGFIAAFFAGLLPGYIAYKKGYNFFLWWLYGLALLLIALPHSLLLKTDPKDWKRGDCRRVM